MQTTKPWYLSRTIWASIVMIAATLGGAFGLPIANADVGALTDALTQTVAALAGLVAIIGRLTAHTRIE